MGCMDCRYGNYQKATTDWKESVHCKYPNMNQDVRLITGDCFLLKDVIEFCYQCEFPCFQVDNRMYTIYKDNLIERRMWCYNWETCESILVENHHWSIEPIIREINWLKNKPMTETKILIFM